MTQTFWEERPQWDGDRREDRKIKCWGFGKEGHIKYTLACPAKEKSCPVCKRKGHFQAFCGEKREGKVSKIKNPAPVEPMGNLGLLSPGMESGHFFSFSNGELGLEDDDVCVVRSHTQKPT